MSAGDRLGFLDVMMRDGLCGQEARDPTSQVDPMAWQMSPGNKKTAKGRDIAVIIDSAKAVCQKCPLRAGCLEYALTHDETGGTWGGLDEGERAKLKADVGGLGSLVVV